MAVLTNPVVAAVSSGVQQGGARWVVLDFQKVTAGDTYDFATLPAAAGGPFQTLLTGYCVALTNRTETFAVGTVAGTILTMIGAGISSDACTVFAVGT